MCVLVITSNVLVCLIPAMAAADDGDGDCDALLLCAMSTSAQMSPYKCISTGNMVGMLEIVLDSATVAHIVEHSIKDGSSGFVRKFKAAKVRAFLTPCHLLVGDVFSSSCYGEKDEVCPCGCAAAGCVA